MTHRGLHLSGRFYPDGQEGQAPDRQRVHTDAPCDVVFRVMLDVPASPDP